MLTSDGLSRYIQIPVSDTQAYRQFGNSVVMPVMQEVARIMAPHTHTHTHAHVQALIALEHDWLFLPIPIVRENVA